MNEPYDLIQTVQLTEKASLLGEKLNKYVFRVNPRANKIQIKHAIEDIFGVKVTNVNTLTRKGKRKQNRKTGTWGQRVGQKRAIVSLADGDRIEIFGS